MPTQLTAQESFEKIPLRQFTEKAYLNYSMYVILDRALPYIGDGLKPVQRRIIYAMSELHLDAQAKHKKSARTVGDVLGKFHPHGDSACYEAMVLMAQEFSYRYPLIDGQGNFGSIDDPKSFAAMRYTESRLSKYADVLLEEIHQGTVSWIPNFDGTLQEPVLLPARLPNILLNGTTGIAVGMATDIPPHNLQEVTNACIHLLDNPEASLQDLMQYVQAPDFPTAAEIITPKNEIAALYKSGYGSVKMRAVYVQEEGDIVITALPYQVSSSKVLEQIAQQMQAKKLPLIADLRDESDHEEPVRLVIVPRSNRVEVEELMDHLFATTDLERSYRVNLNMIGLDGKPKVFGLVEILNEWLIFRSKTVQQRLQFRLDKVLARLHILDGLLIAFLNIDEVIHIIRYEDKPKEILMAKFNLTEIQTEAILDLKLRHLARLEEIKIRGEQEALAKEKDMLEKTLASKKLLHKLIRQELSEDAAKYGDARRSPIVVRKEAQALKEIEILPTEPITVILSAKGWVRAAKGHEVDAANLNYRSGDEFKMQQQGRSNQQAIFLDSTGRSYSIPAHTLPSARGQGEPLTSKLTPPPEAIFESVILDDANATYILASDAGYGFITKIENLISKNRSGKAILTLPSAAKILAPQPLKNPTDYVAAATSDGHLLIFSAEELPTLPKGKGNKIINIPAAKKAAHQIFVVSIATLSKENNLTVEAGRRKLVLKPNDWAHFIGERGQRGKKLPSGLQRVDRILS